MIELGFPQFSVEDFYDTFVESLDKLAKDKDKGEVRISSEEELHSTFNDQV